MQLTPVTMSFDTILDVIYGFSFDLLGVTIDSGDLATTIKDLLSFATISNSLEFTLYSYVADINSVAQSIGIALLTLFFMIGLIQLLTQEGVERISWERITLKACMFFILYALITQSMDLFESIGSYVNSEIYGAVKNKIMTLNAAESYDIPGELYTTALEAGNIEKYLYYAVYIILAIPYNATIIMIISQVFLRAVKILFYIMFSPIPIAMAAEEEVYRGKALTYFASFIAVCFEAVFIYIGLFIYMSGMSDLSTSNPITCVIQILFLNGLFSAIIGASSQLSQTFFGRG